MHDTASRRRLGDPRWVMLLVVVVSLAAPHDSGAQPSFATGQTISPAYEGWERNPDGSFNLVFGYMNRNWEEEIDVPIGLDNSIAPGRPDQGQPTHFLPRRSRFVFRIRVPADFGDKELGLDPDEQRADPACIRHVEARLFHQRCGDSGQLRRRWRRRRHAGDHEQRSAHADGRGQPVADGAGRPAARARGGGHRRRQADRETPGADQSQAPRSYHDRYRDRTEAVVVRLQGGRAGDVRSAADSPRGRTRGSAATRRGHPGGRRPSRQQTTAGRSRPPSADRAPIFCARSPTTVASRPARTSP